MCYFHVAEKWVMVRNDFKMDDICINIICIMYFFKVLAEN
jgi:hypothetical protein